MDSEWTVKRLMELADRARGRGRCTFTDFLGQAELDAFHAAGAGFSGVRYSLSGGAPGCQRQMIRFYPEDAGDGAEGFPIVCLRITPLSMKFAESLAHRDILGALMGLGFERNLIGDIIVRDGESYLFAAAHIARYVMDGLKEVKRTAVRCEPAASLPEGALYRLARETVQAASPRLDAVIAHVYRLSRGDSQDLFPRGFIAVNGRTCENDSYALKEDDTVSVRGHSRFIYRGVTGMSKKGKCNIAIDRYV